MDKLGPEIIAAALATPVWFATRLVIHHARNLRAIRAWQRELR